ncbi:trypsin-like peptidase domain-containing protein [Streptomyces sp. NPDC001937]
MSPLDTNRVAQVVVIGPGKYAEYGSGYRISRKLIVTAAHLLGTSSACQVMLGDDMAKLPTTVVWRGSGSDLALLRLDEVPAELGPASGVPLGRLPDGVGSVPFVGIGFPAYAQREETDRFQGLGRRDSRQIDGRVNLGSNMKSGYLDLTITTSPPTEKGPGGQDAWKGISGMALFTQQGVLIGVQTHRLPAAGTGSAEGESLATALADPAFTEILRQNRVRPEPVQVEASGREPGRRLRSVLSQQELIEGFGDFEKNLTSNRLPYVSPGNEHKAHPDELFTRLIMSGERGVLLVGAAGTGKSRTGLEVGQLALEEDWRVLHVVSPHRRESNTEQFLEEIAEHAFTEAGSVLVVIDLNETNLDLNAVRQQLLPEARRRNVTMALLASARPGWLLRADRALVYELFDEVQLRQDAEFQELVTRKALETLAPTAKDRLGIERMLALSGNRPIIALLVAREIERRIKADLEMPATVGLRSGGELAAWLLKRLSEDGYTVPGRRPDDPHTPARASDGLVAASAAAAACPQEHGEIVAAAQATLTELHGSGPQAEGIVATLVSLGWLEHKNDVLSVAHDIVADQLMESVMLPEPKIPVPDVAGTRAMLAGGLTSARTIGRFSVNISRLVNDLTFAECSTAVTPVLHGWFTEHATLIGGLLRADSSVGGYALGAICSGPPWSNAAVECWDQIVSPWLTDFGGTLDARHVLYRGLRHLPANGARFLVPVALEWLKAHGLTPVASYVAGSLFSRTDVSPDAVHEATTTTLAWLNRHNTGPHAGYVLSPLLARTDLSPLDTRRVISAAKMWLSRHATTFSAGFVLSALFARPDLTAEDVRQVLAAAFTWLKHHTTTLGAAYILKPLLSQRDLEPSSLRNAVKASLGWLVHYATTVQAESVVTRLLGSPELSSDDTESALSHALEWLDHHAASVDAEFLLGQLLDRTDLPEQHSRRVRQAALSWLDHHVVTEKASYIVKRVLGLPDLTEDEVLRTVTAALRWLDDNLNGDAGHVLRPVLARPDLPADDAQRAIRFARAWLSEYRDTSDAGFVLDALLPRIDLDAETVEESNSVARDWLDRYATELYGEHVICLLLSRAGGAAGRASAGVGGDGGASGDQPDPERQSLFAHALAWLDLHSGVGEARFILSSLLGRTDLDRDDVRRTTSHALAWLDLYAAESYASHVLQSVLGRTDLDRDDVRRTTAHALAWLDLHAAESYASHILSAVLGRTDLDRDDVRRTTSHAFAWLDLHSGVGEARFILTSLLGRTDLDRDDVRRTASHAFAWLDLHSGVGEARFVLQSVLGRTDLDRDDVRRATAHAFAWLDLHSGVGEARFVLQSVLGRTDLDRDDVQCTTAHAFAWLDLYAAESYASHVLQSVLGRTDLDRDDVQCTTSHAFAWLDLYAAEFYASYVLSAVLGRTDLDRDDVRRATAHAFAWLDLHVAEFYASHVLSAVLGRTDLDRDDVRRATAHAFAWLDLHSGVGEARFVLQSVLGRTDLDRDDVRRATAHAFAWLDLHSGLGEARFVLTSLLKRPELVPDQARQALSTALTWLNDNATAPGAPLLLRPLLSHTGLTTVDAASVISVAFTWLNRYADGARARFVLAPLLTHPKLTPVDTHRAVTCALTWLQAHGTTGKADLVLAALRSRLDLTPDAAARLRGYDNAGGEGL